MRIKKVEKIDLKIKMSSLQFPNCLSTFVLFDKYFANYDNLLLLEVLDVFEICCCCSNFGCKADA